MTPPVLSWQLEPPPPLHWGHPCNVPEYCAHATVLCSTMLHGTEQKSVVANRLDFTLYVEHAIPAAHPVYSQWLPADYSMLVHYLMMCASHDCTVKFPGTAACSHNICHQLAYCAFQSDLYVTCSSLGSPYLLITLYCLFTCLYWALSVGVCSALERVLIWHTHNSSSIGCSICARMSW